MKKLLLFLAFTALYCGASAQDLIILRNAETIDAKILRVGGSRIEYTQTGNASGRVYTLSTGEVQSIRYKDGREERFQAPVTKPERKLAQYRNLYPAYQGEISVAYGLGLGGLSKTTNTDHIIVETVHGVRLSPYAFVGAGVGLNYFHGATVDANGKQLSGDTFSASGIISAFGNAKGYYPLSKSINLYLSVDLGASIGIWGDMRDMRNLYVAAGPGVTIGSQKNRMNCDFGVRLQHMGSGFNAILFRVGFGF